jgi:site-specific DNA recombinase
MWSSNRNDGSTRVARSACVKRPGAPGCGATTIVADPLEALVAAAVLHRLGSKAMALALSRKPTAKKHVDADLARIERDLEEIAQDFGNGEIPRREWLAARKPLEDRLAAARRTLDAESGTAALAELRDVDVATAWERLSVDRRRAVLDALVDRIVIKPVAKSVSRFDAGRVDVVWRV